MNKNITTEEEKQQPDSEINTKLDESGSIYMQGHIKILDPSTGEVLVEKRNAIHFENFSQSLASMVGNKNDGFIYEMHFGNGGTSVDSTGIITYLPPNNVGTNADLYNQTYAKVVDDTSNDNLDKTRNYIEVRHIAGKKYTDIFVVCLLDYGEPSQQAAFDNSADLNSDYVFDELGLKGYDSETESTGKLLTHVIFHPVQKSLNRLIQIEYTVRIQTLSTL